MSEIYTYDSTDVQLVLGGGEVTGFGADTKIVISRDSALAEGDNGVDGDTMISYFNTTKGKAEITLMYGSKWDSILDQTASMKLPLAFAFYHQSSNKVLVTYCWVEEQPDVSIGTKPEDRTWVFGLQNADFSIAASVEAGVSAVQHFIP